MALAQAKISLTPYRLKHGLTARSFSIFGGVPVTLFLMDQMAHWDALIQKGVLSPFQREERINDLFSTLCLQTGLTMEQIDRCSGLVEEMRDYAEITTPHFRTQIMPVKAERFDPMEHPAFFFSQKAQNYLNEQWFVSKETGNKVVACSNIMDGPVHEKCEARLFTYSSAVSDACMSMAVTGSLKMKHAASVYPPANLYRFKNDLHEAYHLLQLDWPELTDKQSFMRELGADLFAQSLCGEKKSTKAIRHIDLLGRQLQMAYTGPSYSFAPALEALTEDHTPPSYEDIQESKKSLEEKIRERHLQIWPQKIFCDSYQAFQYNPRFVFYPLSQLVAEKAFKKEPLTADIALKAVVAARYFNPTWTEPVVLSRRKCRREVVFTALSNLSL